MNARILLALAVLTAGPGILRAQTGSAASPTEALTGAFSAACRQKGAEFAGFLPEESAAAYRNLPVSQQNDLMQRLTRVSAEGKPLRSTAADGASVLRCSTPSETTELRLSRERIHSNLAFVSVAVTGGRNADFGLVREGSGWRLISLGLLMLNVPEIAKQWAAQEIVAREIRAIGFLREIASAAETYHKGFGNYPETLAQLGPPAAQAGASPDAGGLIDSELAAGTKENYRFQYRAFSNSMNPDEHYQILATPIEYGPGGKRSFFLDSSGVLRGGDKNGVAATADDPRISEVVVKQPE
jgi:hypothetical protein